MGVREFLKDNKRFVQIALGMLAVYLIILLFKAGYLTGQYLQTLGQ